MLHGYDVAYPQTGVNWGDVTADFVIAKATQGVTLVDRLYASHTRGAKSRGIPVGGYHFAMPVSNSPEAEAAHFLDICPDGQITPVLDCETYGFTNPLEVLGADRLADWCDRWAVFVHNVTGRHPLFYSFRSYASAVAPRLTGPWSGVWLATATGQANGAYLGRSYGHLKVLLEQYDSPTDQPGFPTAVDVNVADSTVYAQSGSTPIVIHLGETNDVDIRLSDDDIFNLKELLKRRGTIDQLGVRIGAIDLMAWNVIGDTDHDGIRAMVAELLGRPPVDVDEAALAQSLVPLLVANMQHLAPADLALVEEAVKNAIREGTG